MGNWIKNVDPNVWILTLLTMFFASLLFMSDTFFKDDNQLFQVMAGLLTMFAGALLAIIKAKAGINGQTPTPPAPAPAPPAVLAPAPVPPPPPPLPAGGGH